MKSVNELLQELTIPEKAALLEGYQSWMTNAIPRLGIPSIHLTDGPVGVRKKAEEQGEGVMGLGTSCPATAFPTSVSIANSWNPDNAEKMGRAIGEECIAYDVQVLLGPALNLKRDPRCGRNFEYYSEDPLLAGKLAAAFTRGVQSTGTAACAKHFALNNSENYRYMGDSVIDERAARELYLRPFEICVKEGHPRTMMCAYNKVNGTHCSENRWLLTEVLREEWGFDGAVMTDWGATRDRLEGVRAGLDLDMPGGMHANRGAIIRAAESGVLPMEVLDQAAGNMLKLIRESLNTPPNSQGLDDLLAVHSTLAEELAEDCAVLLKNDGTLPLTGESNVLVVGELFVKMRYQGAGSSGLHPARLVTPADAFASAGVHCRYVTGYHEVSRVPDVALEEEALKAAEAADVILFFGGLTELFESEGYDREDLSMPDNQLQLFDRLCKTEKPVVAVLFGGSPMELPFAEDCAAILHMFLPGQCGGEACRRLLYGEANPGGRLSETWMRTCGEIPCGDRFGKCTVEQYRENIFVGYRYYDQAPEKIRYPFGYGLSYTTFAYRDLTVTRSGGTITARLTVSNTGAMTGSEVAQLYVRNNDNSRVFKAEKELRAFAKVTLRPGESRRVTMAFPETDLAYYNTRMHAWVTENGTYTIQIGASSRDIRLTQALSLTGYPEAEGPYSPAVLAAYANIAACRIPDAVFEETIGRPVPDEPPLRPYTIESPLSSYQSSTLGRFLYRSLMRSVDGSGKKIAALPEGEEKDAMRRNQRFMRSLIPRNSTRALIQSSGGGRIQMGVAYAITDFANGHPLRAVRWLMRKEKVPPLPCEEQGETPHSP